MLYVFIYYDYYDYDRLAINIYHSHFILLKNKHVRPPFNRSLRRAQHTGKAPCVLSPCPLCHPLNVGTAKTTLQSLSHSTVFFSLYLQIQNLPFPSILSPLLDLNNASQSGTHFRFHFPFLVNSIIVTVAIEICKLVRHNRYYDDCASV